MKYLFTSLLFLIFLCHGQKDENKILWSSKKIVWNDFTGIANNKNENLLAITQCEIKITDAYWDDNIPRYIIKSFFIKDKSWTKVDDELTLKHEQLHFDIYELYARKIRKKFEELNSNSISKTNVYDSIYFKLVNKAIKENNRYDNEVYFNNKKQQEWLNRISKELEGLKEYEYVPRSRW
jgi:hypothetical protein